MKYAYYAALLLLAAFTVDLAVTHLQEYVKARKRQRDMDRYSLSPFRGVKKFDDGELG